MPSDNPVDGPRHPAGSPTTPELTNSLFLSDHQQLKGKEKCPRCESRDTKFCYYNNYNTSQPRHFCRSCRRYWTLGGSLRNVPIGGSSRQNTHNTSNKRLRPNPSSTTTAAHHATGWLEPFRFDLGLGLGIRAGPGRAASIEDMGFSLGPTTLVWPSSLLVEGGGVVVAGHDCFNAVPGAVSAPVDGSAGPTNGEVH